MGSWERVGNENLRTGDGWRAEYSNSVWDFFACLVLGHLCLLPVWELVMGGAPRLFFLDVYVGKNVVWPLVALTFSLAMIGFYSSRHLTHQLRRLFQVVWIFLIMLALFSLMRVVVYGFLNKHFEATSRPLIKLAIVAIPFLSAFAALLAQGLTKWLKTSLRILRVMSPLVAIIWFQSFRAYPFSAAEQVPGGARIVLPATGRTVWVLLFDELDEKISAGVAFPRGRMAELDRWKAFSICGTNAYPPAGGTLWSIPALIQGKQISDVPHDVNYVKSWSVLLEVGRDKGWKWEDNLFTDVTRVGGRCALIGWGAFPYEGTYETSVDQFWSITGRMQATQKQSQASSLKMAKIIALDIVVGPILAAKINPATANANKRMLEETHHHLAKLLNGELPNLVWVHYPIPHWPSVKDNGTYLDNLQAVDQELKYFRENLQENGCWDRSTVLVLADHWLRKPGKGMPVGYSTFLSGCETRWEVKDHRIPFLLKLPDQKTSCTIEAGFNLIVLRDLLKALRSGEVNSTENLASWLIRNSPYAESPTTAVLP